MRFSLTVAAAALLTACQPTGPVFKNVTTTTVKHVGSRGLTERTFTDRELNAVADCLYTTKQVDEEPQVTDLLPTTYLVEVHDLNGVRSFELYTARNLKGNKGKYFINGCLYDLIQEKPRRRAE